MEHQVALENPLCLFLDKPQDQFTRQDLLQVTAHKGIERFVFHYTGLDSQIKELNLPIASLKQAERILAAGERVDGSSLFKGLIETSNSDLYVVPSYKSAFISPFDNRSLHFMCRFLDRDGNRAMFTPDNVLAESHNRFKQHTGFELHALGELEFFLIGERSGDAFLPARQTGYHASGPFFNYGEIVNEMVRYISQITGAIKYAHAEVGFLDSVRSDKKLLKGKRAEQHEIEFLTRPVDMMGDFIALSRWIIRNVAYQHGMLATFVPKLEEGIAGNGFHVHMELVKNGKNIMSNDDGTLSDEAMKLIGGVVHYASSLSAFGNTVASAFLRLVPDQEAPTKICWSDANRSSLIRVPLGWSKTIDLAAKVNPQQDIPYEDQRGYQTVELRSPDGSAMFNLLLAGITTAAEYGLTHDNMYELAQKTKVSGDIFADKELFASLEPLPGSCVAAAELLNSQRNLFEEHGCFPARLIDHVCDILRKEDDKDLNRRLSRMPADERLTATRQIMHRDIHRN